MNILLADDEEIVFQTLGDVLRDPGHQLAEARDGLSALQMIQSTEYDLALVDVRMPGLDGISLLAKAREIQPDMAIVMISGHGDVEIAVQAMRLGASDLLRKPIRLTELKAALVRAAQMQALRDDARRLRETIREVQASDDLRSGYRELVGHSVATDQVRKQIELAVKTGCETVLITGETGVGKEVVAREIHYRAGSHASPFIAVSCPALPETLIESELFGHAKGAFTGATCARAGCFELADGGTLFLDEVGDLSDSAQATLLRASETRTVRRVGSSQEVKVNVRFVAATNSPLADRVATGRFRRDLFYRLNLFTIHVSPLRERRRDILPLAEHFLSGYATSRGLHFESFSKHAKASLLAYGFPGNARELRNLVERAAMVSGSGQIQVEHLAFPLEAGRSASSRRSDPKRERTDILRVLEETSWNRTEAAQVLGIPYSTFRYKMKKLGIE